MNSMACEMKFDYMKMSVWSMCNVHHVKILVDWCRLPNEHATMYTGSSMHWENCLSIDICGFLHAYACMREFGYIFVIRQLNETKSLMHMHMQKRSTKAFYVHAMHSNFVSLMNANIIENIIPIMSSMPSSWSCRLRSQNRNQSRLES